MIFFHWWAVTSRSPINFGRALKICNPKYTDMFSQVFKLWSHGTLFTNNGFFYMCYTFHEAFHLPAFSTKVITSSHFFRCFSAKSFSLNIKVRISWNHRTQRDGIWREISYIVTFNEGLRMSNTGFSVGISLYQQEGHNLTLDLNPRYLIFLLF